MFQKINADYDLWIRSEEASYNVNTGSLGNAGVAQNKRAVKLAFRIRCFVLA